MDDLPPPLKPLGKQPRLGRAALIAVLAMWGLFLFLKFSGAAIGIMFADTAAEVFGIGSYPVGAGLAIASLVKRERKGPAITTLCLLISSPLLFGALVILVWWSYGMGLG